jgi:putative ABC transport system permease protein
MRRRGWEPARKGWFIEADEPLTSGQLMEARALAADAGLTVEARDRDRQQTLAALRSGATIAGMVVALCVLAMTVGLIRSEAAGDLRTLTATGATSTIRRMLTAATAGSLGLLGATLATVGAYVGLAAGYVGDIGTLGQVPVLHLLAMTVGVPVAAASAGWLLAGREPAGLARQAME